MCLTSAYFINIGLYYNLFNMNPIYIQMKNIHKSYDDVEVLKGVSTGFYGGEIHALIGSNGAGKSTLMNVLAGCRALDEGEIYIDDIRVNINSVNTAEQNGIVMIHQELNLMDDLSVAQNIFINNEPTNGFIIDDKKMIEDTKPLLEMVGLNIDPNTKVKDLSIGKKQMIEIAKALSKKSRFLIFDEPTSSLSNKEVEELFKIINDLKDQGIGIIYISHRLYEIFKIADKISVLKDGDFVGTYDAKEMDEPKLIKLMVGKDIKNDNKEIVKNDNDVILSVNHLCRGNVIKDVSFTLKKGEVLGFYGLVGAGRSEVARAITGIDEYDSGDIYINGTKVKFNNPYEAIKHGLCYLSEDRRRDGMLFGQDLVNNTVISSLDNYDKFGIIDDKLTLKDMRDVNKNIATKYRDPSQNIESLSGGNQQKILISRWLLKDFEILILDEPTRGIDVGAKQDIYEIIEKIVKMGKSIIVISSEADELRKVCDRIVVMFDGKVNGIVIPSEVSDTQLMDYAID